MKPVIAYFVTHKKVSLISLLMLIVIFDVGVYYFSKPRTTKPKNIVEVKADKTMLEEAKKQKELINNVDKQITLPKDEQPILATVTDKTLLQNQEFFADAQNGDKILLYPKNKKAFLYRPSLKKVLVQAPLQYGDASESASLNTTPTPTLTPDQVPTYDPTIPTPIPRGKVLKLQGQ